MRKKNIFRQWVTCLEELIKNSERINKRGINKEMNSDHIEKIQIAFRNHRSINDLQLMKKKEVFIIARSVLTLPMSTRREEWLLKLGTLSVSEPWLGDSSPCSHAKLYKKVEILAIFHNYVQISIEKLNFIPSSLTHYYHQL